MSNPIQPSQDPENPQPVEFVDPKPDVNSPCNDMKDKKNRGSFPIWTATEFAAYQPPPDRDILGQAILRKGNLTLLMGQPGIGKSTTSFALAIANVRGDNHFAGIPLTPKPCRWLFIGNENGADRWKEHFANANQALTAEQSTVLEKQIHVAALFDDENPDLSLPDQEDRLEATVRAAKADVVVLDPWSEIVSNEIDSSIVRASITSLRGAIRRANRHAAILVVCHAKAGRELVADNLSNFGAGSAQRGNRLLFSAARAALLLAPFDDDGLDLVLVVTKCNDGPLIKPRRILLDRKAFRYQVNADFHLEAWGEGLRNKSKPKQKVSAEMIQNLVREGHTNTKALMAQLADRASERTTKKAIANAVEDGLILRTGHGTFRLDLT